MTIDDFGFWILDFWMGEEEKPPAGTLKPVADIAA
jgi:hypothetical protein